MLFWCCFVVDVLLSRIFPNKTTYINRFFLGWCSEFFDKTIFNIYSLAFMVIFWFFILLCFFFIDLYLVIVLCCFLWKCEVDQTKTGSELMAPRGLKRAK